MSATQSPPSVERLESVLHAYGIEPAAAQLDELHIGHINLTWRVLEHDRPTYLLQRINHRVFERPARLIENVAIVTRHIGAKLRASGSTDPRRWVELLPTEAGRDYHRDLDGWVWRLYRFIPDTETHRLATPALAESAARAYGDFQRLLSDLDERRLTEVIPRFHDSAWRFAQLEDAASNDRCGRRAGVSEHLDRLYSRRHLARPLRERSLPRRVVHNDTKLTNVLFDRGTTEPLCVVDFDTVMPGLVAHDFGDAVRSMAHLSAEDTPRGAGVAVDVELFSAITRGYLSSAGKFLEPVEVETLFDGALVIVLEMAVRFLADYLDGDRYFRTAHAEQNLDRTLTQIALLESLIEREAELRQIVASIAGR